MTNRVECCYVFVYNFRIKMRFYQWDKPQNCVSKIDSVLSFPKNLTSVVYVTEKIPVKN